MDKNHLNKIIQVTGRKPVQCSCDKCKKQCRTPCLGTPDDILRLIDAGYISHLRISYWMVGVALGKVPYPIPMVQVAMGENGCIFFENGLCKLHNTGLKPTEGKLSHHSITLENYIFELSLTWNVAKTWLDIDNLTKILKAFVYIELFK